MHFEPAGIGTVTLRDGPTTLGSAFMFGAARFATAKPRRGNARSRRSSVGTLGLRPASRFTEGFGTADLRAAHQLMEDLE
jgi:hypothetical protein